MRPNVKAVSYRVQSKKNAICIIALPFLFSILPRLVDLSNCVKSRLFLHVIIERPNELRFQMSNNIPIPSLHHCLSILTESGSQVTTVCVGLVCQRGYKYGWLDHRLWRVDRTIKAEGEGTMQVEY